MKKKYAFVILVAIFLSTILVVPDLCGQSFSRNIIQKAQGTIPYSHTLASEANLELTDWVLYGVVTSVFVQGNYCYVCAGTCLLIFDITNPSSPVLLGSLTTLNGLLEVFVQGDYAYVLQSGNVFFIVNVSDPQHPVKVGEYELGNFPSDSPYARQREFFISGEYAYFPSFSDGLRILNISDPTNPVEMQAYQPGNSVVGIVTRDNNAYMLIDDVGLAILDFSNPLEPQQIGCCPIEGIPVDISIDGDFAYVSTYMGDSTKVHIIDISNPEAPREKGVYATVIYVQPEYGEKRYGFMAIRDLCISGHYLYFRELFGGLFVLDVTDPSEPKKVAHVYIEQIRELYVSRDFAYCAGFSGGLLIFDISNPASPELVGNWDPGDQVLGIVSSGDYLYAADGYDGLLVLDISDPHNVHQVGFWKGDIGNGFDVGYEFQDLCLSGNYLYVVDSGGRIYVFDITDPTHPIKKSDYDLDCQGAFFIDIAGNYACVTYYSELIYPYGVAVIDISNPSNLREIGRYEPQDTYMGKIRISGQYAYVASSVGLKVIDISEPENPREVGGYDIDGGADFLFIRDHYLYISTDFAGFLILDISEPTVPVKVGKFSSQVFIMGGYIAGNYAYLRILPFLSTNVCPIVVVDISDPSQPKQVVQFDNGICMSGRSMRNVLLKDGYIYASCFYYGLYILKFTPTNDVEENLTDFIVPQKFSLDQNYPNPFNPMTTISYRLPKTAVVTLRIYNLLGQQVRTLVDEVEKPGYYTAQWDGRDEQGMDLPSGVYFYRLRIDRDKFVETKKMLLLR